VDSLPLALLGSLSLRTRVRRTPASSLVCLRSLPALLPPALGAWLLGGSLLLGCSLLLSCSKQAEGERCDINNGNLDCENGLVCVGEDEISVTGTGFALCCPLTEPTADACRANMSLPPEPDAGTTPLPPVTPPPVMDAGGQPPPATTPDASSSPTDGGVADSGT